MKKENNLILLFLLIWVVVIAILVSYHIKIGELKDKIENLSFKLNYTYSEMLETKDLLSNITRMYEEKLKTQSEELKWEVEERKALENKLKDLELEVENLNSKLKAKSLTNPTLAELKKFLIEDNTDKLEYINNSFVCLDFANTFVKNFMREGYYSCEATLIFDGGEMSHAIVAVNTTDRGLIYVEPQTDQIIYNINIGDNYCSLVNWDCYWKIERISDCFEIKNK
jgi:hypothetical protein